MNSGERPVKNGPILHWVPSAFLLVLGAGPFAALAAKGRLDAPTTVAALVLLAAAWVLSPSFFPAARSDAAARRSAQAAGVPLIYWRPGCTFCLRLRIALGLRGNRAVWVNVARDDAASARVRSVNDGNETVPTVFAGEQVRTNPAPSWVRGLLTAAGAGD